MKNLKLTFPRILAFVSFFVLCISCGEKTKEELTDENSFYTIPFADIVMDKSEVNLSEIAQDVEIIQLENIPEAFIGFFENIKLTKDYIFIQCWDQPILQFSHAGKFIKYIGAFGNGPGEYQNCLKMSVDEKGELVYISTTELNMMVFDFAGNYVNTINFPALESMMNFWTWSRDSMLVSYFEPFLGNEPFVFTEYNLQGDTLQEVPNYIFFNPAEQAAPFQMSPFEDQNYEYFFEDKLHMKGCYNDTVYSYNKNNKIVPQFFIDLGKHKLPEDLIYERKWTRAMPNDLYWTGVHETSDFIFIPYGYHYDLNKPELEREEKGLVLYNKKTKDGMAVKGTKQGGIIDDITGGPDFRPIETNANTALMLVSALDMKEYLNSDAFKNKQVKIPNKKERLKKIGKTLSENDNHFVVLAKLKEPSN